MVYIDENNKEIFKLINKECNMNVKLCPMTDEMYYEYFKEFESDIDLYIKAEDYTKYQYSIEHVSKYISRQKQKKRLPFAIVLGDELIGEIIFKEITEKESATISISMKNDKYKNMGYGTSAEKLAIKYAFESLDMKTVFADSLINNKRSQHVLVKVGFTETGRDDKFVYYKIERE